MALSSRELDRYAEDVYKDRRITRSVYCGNCGYNLKTLPYVYRCPDCGQEYNARPRVLQGIHQPHLVEIPFGDIASTLFCGLCVFLLLRQGFFPIGLWRLIAVLVFVALTLIFLSQTWSKLAALSKSRRIAKRIAANEE